MPDDSDVRQASSGDGRASAWAGQPSADASTTITIRPLSPADRPFYASIVDRLTPVETAAQRDPVTMSEFNRRVATGEAPEPAGAETFLAVGLAGEPLGVLSLNPTRDYFTGQERAYISVLVVAEEAEGRGVGTALLQHAEAWALVHGYTEVSLDVFASNTRARAFYERTGYRPDWLHLVKRLEAEPGVLDSPPGPSG